jgi:site-specific recombinase XerC
MAVQADPYLSAYLRKPRIPDPAVVPGPGEQSKTILPPRRRPRAAKDLDAGPLEAEVGSFALHMAAEGKAPRTIGNYTEAVRWFAAACVLPETGKRRWDEVDTADLRRWTVRLLGEYSTAYAGNQFRAVRRFLRWLAVEEDRPDPVKGLRAPAVKVSLVPVFTSDELSALRRACQGRSFADRRDAAVLAVFEATGIRLSELAGIRYCPDDPGRGDLNLYGRAIRVVGKGGKPRIVTISFEAARSLDRYLRVRARHPQAGRPELWLGANGRGPADPGRDLPARRAQRGAGGARGAPAAVPAPLQPYLARPWRRSGRPDGTERLVLPADAHLVRCQRPRRPRPPPLRPHHEPLTQPRILPGSGRVVDDRP